MKLTNFILIITGLMILFSLAGVSTSLGYVLGTLDLADNPSTIIGSPLYIAVLAILAVAAAGSIIIGLFAKAPVENLLIVPLVGLFALFLGDLVSIISMTGASCGVGSSCRWAYYIVVAIVTPLSVVFLMSLIDWWRGRE